MIELTRNEEDYLKALFQLSVEQHVSEAGTNQLAEYLGVSPSSVNAMIKKLKTKDLVASERYGKLALTEDGRAIALRLVRKHRLWETFLYEKMNFSWDEVHDVAEQLEHIRSEKLISELDKFLGYPKADPHGDSIPDAQGNYKRRPKRTLSEVPIGGKCRLLSVKDSSVAFLKYVTEIGLALSSDLEVVGRLEFDDSIQIRFDDSEVSVSKKFADNVFVSVAD